VKAKRLKRSRRSHRIDPKLGELMMTRLKLRSKAMEGRTSERCKVLG